MPTDRTLDEQHDADFSMIEKAVEEFNDLVSKKEVTLDDLKASLTDVPAELRDELASKFLKTLLDDCRKRERTPPWDRLFSELPELKGPIGKAWIEDFKDLLKQGPLESSDLASRLAGVPEEWKEDLGAKQFHLFVDDCLRRERKVPYGRLLQDLPELQEAIVPRCIEEFQKSLKERSVSARDLKSLLDEVPQHLKVVLGETLWRTYLEVTNEKNETVPYDSFMQEVPELKDIIQDTWSSKRVAAPEPETESKDVRNLGAEVNYTVQKSVWKSGGQGDVHKANERAIGDRQVVVKFLKHPFRKRQFQKEVEVTAKLDHPGVVAVHSRGEERDGEKRPFFTMRLVHGKPLEDRIATFHNSLAKKQSDRERSAAFTPFDGDEGTAATAETREKPSGGIAQLIEPIISACNTVSHAHSMGVLHCDLKPKNIVCGRFDATLVIDWGSVSPCQVPEIPTEQDHDSAPPEPIEIPDGRTGEITTAYASPEQLETERKAPLTPASDVFALGATLYQALTGRSPFGSNRTVDDEAPRANEVCRFVPKRLAAICAKAMQHQPGKRYATPKEFADDLKRWLRDEPIKACPENLLSRGFRVARRHQVATSISIAMLLLITVGSVVVSAILKSKWESDRRNKQTTQNLDLTLDLIDGVCEPLANDEVKNLKEFDEIKTKVDKFAKDFIEKGNSAEPRQLAQAYKFQAIMRFYEYTREGQGSEKSQKATVRRPKLQAAIDALVEAESLLSDNEAESLLSDNEAVALTKVRLMRARWQWSMALLINNRTDDDRMKQLMVDSVALLRKVIASLRGLQAEGVRIDSAETDGARQFEIMKAEAHHLLAVYLNDGMRYRAFADVQDQAIDNFGDAIKILLEERERIGKLPKELREKDSELIQRNLARGYGYRGDLYRDLGQIDKAIADYISSLEIRKKIENTSDNIVESRFQLARGYVNFGNLVRYFGDRVSTAASFNGQVRNPDESIEDYVLRTCMVPAIEIQTKLLNNKDQRFVVDLVSSLNTAAELHLFAAEHRELPENKREEHLKLADENAERVVQQIAKGPTSSLKATEKWNEAVRDLTREQKRDLARALMLKMRIARLSGKTAEDIGPTSIIFLVNDEAIRPRHEEDLIIFAVATAARSKTLPNLEASLKNTLIRIVEELAKRRFSKKLWLKRHLNGIKVARQTVDDLLNNLPDIPIRQ